MQENSQQPSRSNQSQTDDFSMPQNQVQYTSGSGRGFNSSGFFSTRKVGLSGFEWALVLCSIFVVIVSFGFGFLWQDTANRDAARAHDISEVITALENFYKNSSLDPSNKKYPLATCSARLNEVDFELNLRLNLTGQLPQLDQHSYIPAQKFPKDISGVYSQTNAQRTVPYRCQQNLPASNTSPIYEEWPSCNFDQVTAPRNCYLYTSTNNGDTFEIAYYSESRSGFVIFKKFRDDPISTRFVPIS